MIEDHDLPKTTRTSDITANRGFRKGQAQNEGHNENLKLYSPAFNNNARIPVKYCDLGINGGKNISIPLYWTNVPQNVQNLFLVIVDPHPIARNWIHWVIRNIPKNVHRIEENASRLKILPENAIELQGTQGDPFYHGPQPPNGTGSHPYEIHLYALKTNNFAISNKPTWQEIQDILSPITIQEAVLTGYYP